MYISRQQLSQFSALVAMFSASRLSFVLADRDKKDFWKKDMDRLYNEIQQTFPVEFDSIAAHDMFKDEDGYLHWFLKNADAFYNGGSFLKSEDIAKIITEKFF